MNIKIQKHMQTSIQPIKPDEVSARHESTIPSVVIETINDLIVKSFTGKRSVIYQDDILEQLVNKGLNRIDIFKNRWLDIENLYRSNGWHVEYDKPAYNESYRANFIFSKK